MTEGSLDLGYNSIIQIYTLNADSLSCIQKIFKRPLVFLALENKSVYYQSFKNTKFMLTAHQWPSGSFHWKGNGRDKTFRKFEDSLTSAVGVLEYWVRRDVRQFLTRKFWDWVYCRWKIYVIRTFNFQHIFQGLHALSWKMEDLEKFIWKRCLCKFCEIFQRSNQESLEPQKSPVFPRVVKNNGFSISRKSQKEEARRRRKKGLKRTYPIYLRSLV